MSLLSDLRKNLSAPNEEEKRKQREQLDFLLNMAKSKLNAYEIRLTDMYKNPDEADRWQVVAQRQVKVFRQYRVNVSEGADAALGDVVDTFFQIGTDKDDDKNKALKGGFQKLIKATIDDILGNATMGEQETSTWSVCVEHNAIVRVDAFIWRYNFSAKGIISEAENAMCYAFCKGVVDHTKLTEDEFTYLISEHTGDAAADVIAYIDSLKSIWAALKSKPVDEVVEHHALREARRPLPLVSGA